MVGYMVCGKCVYFLVPIFGYVVVLSGLGVVRSFVHNGVGRQKP